MMKVLERELLSTDVQQAPSQLVAQISALAHLLAMLHELKHLPLVEGLPVILKQGRCREDLIEYRVVDRLLRNEWVGLRLWQGLKDSELVLEREALD